jgi:hypothetical protein
MVVPMLKERRSVEAVWGRRLGSSVQVGNEFDVRVDCTSGA